MIPTDIAIAGAGLGGSLAAVVLARAGYRVALIDRYRAYPPEFRVEKFAGEQVELLRRLGLFDCVAAASTRFEQVINARHGRVIDRTNTPHYGIFYQDFVNVVRAQLPGSATFVVGQAIDVRADAERPRVVLADDTVVEARLSRTDKRRSPGSMPGRETRRERQSMSFSVIAWIATRHMITPKRIR